MRFAAKSLLLGVVALGGCASNSYVVLLEDPQGGVGKVSVTGKSGTQLIDRALYAANLDGTKAPEPVDMRRFNADFAEVIAARPVLPSRYLLYFQTGGSELTEASRAQLASIVDDVRGRPAADVSVIGHTDTVGTAEANEALALQRAKGIAAMLTEQGMKPFALAVESHGERNLLVPTADEADEPRNRRVEVSVR